jgi:hypothetical protein
VGARALFLGISVHFVSGGINHDPELFEDPEAFNPDRYLRSEYGTKPGVDVTDFRHTIMFGAGRVGHLNAAVNYPLLMALHSEDLCWDATCEQFFGKPWLL